MYGKKLGHARSLYGTAFGHWSVDMDSESSIQTKVSQLNSNVKTRERSASCPRYPSIEQTCWKADRSGFRQPAAERNP